MRLDAILDLPDDRIERRRELDIHHLAQRGDQPQPGDVGCGGHRQVTQQVRDLLMRIRELFEGDIGGLAGRKRQHGRMDQRQHLVVQYAAGALVKDLGGRHALALELHQPLGERNAGGGVNQPLAGRARDLNLFLRVERIPAPRPH